MNAEPLYEARGEGVWKRSVETKREGGFTTYSLGFEVCRCTDVAEGNAPAIAHMLNTWDDMLNALKAAIAPLAATADQHPRGKERLQLVEAAIRKAEGQS